MRRLDWDSDFWGVDIFSIEEFSLSQFKQIEKKFSELRNSYLVQALMSEKDDIKNINLLEDLGFRFIESKITFKKTVTEYASIDIKKYNEINEQELCSRSDVFYELYGKVTRFGVFSKEKINDFYFTWVKNSIDGKMDDKCIGYYEDNQLAGFVTYKYNNNGISIGLIGVFPEYQMKGIGRKLLDYVTNTSINHNYSYVFVSTQGKNLNAINAYIKNGFILDSIKHWYYLLGGKL
jgi:dTDP-4-amino-4,6-dideoxy-D-galactose acyltransferase